MKIKENLFSFIFQVIITILALVGMIFVLASNGVAGYEFKNGIIVPFAVIAFVLSLLSLGVTAMMGEKMYLRNLLNLGLIVFAVICLFAIINGRVITIGAIFSFDAGNLVATNAVVTSIIGAIILLIAAIVTTISQFISNQK